MNYNFEYYYNNVPGKGLCRNNLIYTSLISRDRKTFCQWYHNDTEYHKGQNQVVDPSLMDEKWQREIKFITIMSQEYPDLIPKILDIDMVNRKLYLEINGPDMWELAGCQGTDYSKVVPDWSQQLLNIVQAHKNLGIYKISMHPSSYFVVNGQLKSINYFFCYTDADKSISMKSVLSHISEDRQRDLVGKMDAMGLTFDSTLSFTQFQHISFETFKLNFLDEVMESAKKIYN
jgi:hypothetical protein